MFQLFLKMFTICVILSCFVICHCDGYELTLISDEQWPQPYYMHYDAATHSLYFTDYAARQILRFDFHKKRTYRATIEDNIITSFIIPVQGEKNKFAICYNFTVAIIEWNGKEKIAKFDQDEFTVQPAQNNPVTGWDYGKMSPNYEFYGGSFRVNMCSKSPGTRNAAFYHYTRPIYKHLRVSGAFDWDVKNKYLYLCDTCGRVIRQFKWDPKTGNIYDERIVYTLENPESDLVMPHGMTIDRDGCLYIAYYSGGKVVKVDPRTSKKVKEFYLPVKGVSLITFGGPHWDTLFVATQRVPFELSTGKLYLDNSEGSGSIYAIKNIKAKGYPSRKYRSIIRND
ncbi:regucalcin-like [Sitodiplosis mosellana]|uniref:regucalcin-like n=1 Tax=Sitodiplosis mosellana TaxID=263140 RepID=UPI0024442E71|nr:regucalcin-like [Sitodiplosis mosellana]